MAASSPGTRAKRAMLGVLLPALVGCAVVPRNKLEETQSANRELRTALAEAKDSVARLKTQNRDLAARSIEESRRNLALEEANERFERDIMTYQEEREQYAAALDQIKNQVLASSGRSRPTASLDPIPAFLAAHPGSSFDARASRLNLPAASFFREGTAEWLPKPKADLDRLAKALSEARREGWSIVVIEPGGEIRQVSTATASLGPDRVEQVRDLLRKAGYPDKVVTVADRDPSVVVILARNRP